uniref:FCF1 rRNA-processing protein n=1 Tax=Sinocyclocheilus rhinocerous TaxID=307959 RepID=A0A673HM15_9TELE
AVFVHTVKFNGVHKFLAPKEQTVICTTVQSVPVVLSTKYPSCMFFQYNTQLGPPYYILVDTNFINFSIKAKLDVVQSMMDCLYAKCVPCITDCVMAELEKLGMKYRVALRDLKRRIRKIPGVPIMYISNHRYSSSIR